jgi:hypothetical protein
MATPTDCVIYECRAAFVAQLSAADAALATAQPLAGTVAGQIVEGAIIVLPGPPPPPPLPPPLLRHTAATIAAGRARHAVGAPHPMDAGEALAADAQAHVPAAVARRAVALHRTTTER